jgi:integrase
MAKAHRRGFGNVRRRVSGRWQARYTGPDGRLHSAPVTFDTKGDAEAWLSLRHADILRGVWLPPAEPKAAPITLRAYGDAWLAERDLAPSTRDHYAQLLRDHVYPRFGDVPLPAITAAAVRTWYADLASLTGPTARAHAYAVLRSVMATAVTDELIGANPCRVRGGSRAKTTKKMRPATLDELAVIVDHTPERYRLMVQLAVWCSLRFGELAELRRGDVDLKHAILRVRRGVVRTKTGRIVKAPKSQAGIRDVTIPGHVLDDLATHLREHAQPGRDGLLFPAHHGGHLAPASVYGWWYPAREAAGRTDLRFHDLRHTGQTYAAATGANLRELMARAGQSSPAAALRYLHEVDGRQREIADRLAGFATAGNVTPIGTAGKKATRRREDTG